MAEKDFKVKNGLFVNDSANIGHLRVRGDQIIAGDLSVTGTISGVNFDSDFNAKTTDSLAEGDVNLYYTTARADSAARGAMIGGAGLTYDSASGTFSITDTGVDSGVYGSTSKVPVITVNTRGQIDSVGLVSIAGIDSVGFDSAKGMLSIATADGAIFNTTILDSNFTKQRTRDAISVIDDGGDGSLSYDSATGAITYTGPSTAEVHAHFSGSVGITFDSGVISIDSSSDVVFKTVTVDSTQVFGKPSGSVTLNRNQFKGGPNQTVFNVVGATGATSAGFALGINNQYDHIIGTTGNAAANSLVIGLSGTATDFKIMNGVGASPFDLTGGDAIFTLDKDGKIAIPNDTEATTKTDAAVIITGGLGVDKNIRGEDIIAANNIQAVEGKLFGSLDAAALRNLTTGDLAEDSFGLNRYYTDARVDSHIGASINTNNISEGDSNLYYTSLRTDSDARHAISVVDEGGDGSLTYSTDSGILRYTGPSDSEARAHFTAGTGVTITAGEIAVGQAVGTADSIEFAKGTITGSFTVNGDLTVGGDYILNQTTDLRVTNALIKLADSNNSDTVDIGVVGRYRDSAGAPDIRRAGFFRDATNGEWYTFTNLIQDELDSNPAAQTINRSAPSFSLGTWNFGKLRGSYTGFDSDFRKFSTDYTVYESDFTAVSAGRYAIDTSNGVINMTLPATPTTGDYIKLIDVGDWTNNSVIVNRNGSTIEGYSDNFELDLGQSIIEFIYINSNWQVYSSIGQRGERGPKGDSADEADFSTRAQSIAFAVALG